MKQALETFEKIYEGCGEVKKDNLSKHSNELATLVRKDCIPQIEALRQALNVDAVNISAERVDETAKRKHEWVGLTVNEARKFYEKYTNRAELIYVIDKFLEEKNT